MCSHFDIRFDVGFEIWVNYPISMHTSGRCTVSRRHTLPSSARRWPDIGPVMSWPLASAQRWADAGTMGRSGICLASGRCWADIGPMSGQCRANFGSMLGRCQCLPNNYSRLGSMLVYIGPTSTRHWPDIGPTLALHRAKIGPTSAQHRPMPTLAQQL